MRASPIYNPDFLVDKLFKSATTMAPSRYVEFCVASFAKLVPNFTPIQIGVIVSHLDNDFSPTTDCLGTASEQAEGFVGSYRRNYRLDEDLSKCFANNGSALFTSAKAGLQEWLSSDACQKMMGGDGFGHMVRVTYALPFKKHAALSIFYGRPSISGFSPNTMEDTVEYLSFPFFLGWLKVYGFICPETLREWLHLCARMTQPRFLVLRAMAGQGITHAGQLASRLNLATGTIHRHNEMAYEDLLSRGLLAQSAAEQKANRVMELARSYSFFRYGAGRVPRVLPRRNLGNELPKFAVTKPHLAKRIA